MKSYVRNIIKLSCAKILLTSVIIVSIVDGLAGPEDGRAAKYGLVSPPVS